MSTPRDKDLPEAARDTEFGKRGEGAHARDGDSGGTRTKAGSTYGDFVPDRVRPHESTDPAADPKAEGQDEQGEEERVAEANRNKGFDTTHVHTSTTSRKV